MTGLSESFYRGKVAQIQASNWTAEGLDGVLLLDVYNVIYASGFFHTPSERPMGLLIRKSADPVLLVPLLEQENAARHVDRRHPHLFRVPRRRTRRRMDDPRGGLPAAWAWIA